MNDVILKARYESTLNRIPFSSIGLLGLVVVYYYCFRDLAVGNLKDIHLSMSLFNLGLVFGRLLLLKLKDKISPAALVYTFYTFIIAGSFSWLYMSHVLSIFEVVTALEKEAVYDFARVHFFMIIGIVNATPQLFKHSKWAFITNVLVLYAAIFYLAPLYFKTPVATTGGLVLIAIFLAVIIPQYLSNWTIEKEQMEKEYELQQIIDGFPGGVSEIKNGSYKRVNKYIKENIVGIESQKPLRLVDQEIGFLSHNHEWVKTIQQFSASNESRLLTEKNIKTKNGERTFLLALSKMGEDHVLVASVDIQDLVDARKDSESQKAQALEKARLASLGLMAAGIAHEINNPLAVIQNRSDLLINEIKNESFNKEKALVHAEKISPMVQRITRIIQSMRNLNRDSSKDPFQVQTLKMILDDALVLAKEKLQFNSTDLEMSGDALELPIDCRPGEIAQVFINAVNNSIHAVENLDQKWIKIHAQFVSVDKKIKISIVDAGQGISQSIRDKVMVPLFTTKSSNHGTGLGLSLSKKIAQTHGGELYFDHQAENTTLVFELPLSKMAFDEKKKSA